MGKRINVDNNNLSELLNEYAEKEKVKVNKSSIKSKQIKEEINEVSFIEENNKTKKLNIISLVCNGIFLILIIILLISLGSKTNQIQDMEYELEEYEDDMWSYKVDSENLDDLLGGNTYYYVENKLDFFDENVVFVIEGYGDYYYTYDCMMDKVDGEYSYWAYNKEQAIGRGYKRGSCN